MENASKALLIAAAIIIAIILISLGVYVVRQGQSAMQGADLTEQQVAAFNSKWESYKGTQTGSSTKALVNQIENYNRTVTDDKWINIISGDASSTTSFAGSNVTYSGTINSGDRYTITFGYTATGLICAIGIQ